MILLNNEKPTRNKQNQQKSGIQQLNMDNELENRINGYNILKEQRNLAQTDSKSPMRQ